MERKMRLAWNREEFGLRTHLNLKSTRLICNNNIYIIITRGKNGRIAQRPFWSLSGSAAYRKLLHILFTAPKDLHMPKKKKRKKLAYIRVHIV